MYLPFASKIIYEGIACAEYEEADRDYSEAYETWALRRGNKPTIQI